MGMTKVSVRRATATAAMPSLGRPQGSPGLNAITQWILWEVVGPPGLGPGDVGWGSLFGSL